MKAKLHGGHVVAALFAGIFGNILFSAGWSSLGVTLFGGLIAGIFGGSLTALIGQFADPATIGPFFDNAGGIVSGVVIGFSVASVVLMLLGFLISGWILKGGKVRKPWRTTWTAVLISALLNVPLLLLWFTIASNTDGLPVGLIVIVGTAVVGILIWLWMTWAHRGYASEFVGESVTATATATKPIADEASAEPTPPAA